MKISKTSIPGVHLIEIEPIIDRRGFFARAFCPGELARAGIDFTSTQINLARNPAQHTLRGMHFQDPPYAEAKFVRVTRGRIHDVVLDLRPRSPAFKQWTAVELSAERANAVFIPEGCAHGYLTLEDDTDVLYQMSIPHVPGQSRGVMWNDPAFAISWPVEPRLLSDMDGAWPAFADGDPP